MGPPTSIPVSFAPRQILDPLTHPNSVVHASGHDFDLGIHRRASSGTIGAFWVDRRIRSTLRLVDDYVYNFREHAAPTVELFAGHGERSPKDAHEDERTNPTDRQEKSDQTQDDRRSQQSQLSDSRPHHLGRGTLPDKSAATVSPWCHSHIRLFSLALPPITLIPRSARRHQKSPVRVMFKPMSNGR
jgi:hypothetical protein